MRHPIWKKDDFFIIGGERIDMDAEAVELPDEAYLFWGYNHGDPAGPYGKVTEMRVEDGEVTGELTVWDPTWDDNTMEDINCRLGGYFTHVEKRTDLDGSNAVVTKCHLRAVSVVMLADTPSYRLPFLQAETLVSETLF